MKDSVIIEAVRYEPPKGGGPRRSRISALQVGLLAASLAALAALAFLFTARAVELSFTPAADQVDISGGPSLAVGGVHLLLQGDYEVRAQRQGHHQVQSPLAVGPERNQSHSFIFVPLPGLLTVTSDPPGAAVSVDGRPLAAEAETPGAETEPASAAGQAAPPRTTTPLVDVPVAAGERRFRFTLARHQPKELLVTVAGRRQSQHVEVELAPDWGEINYVTEPAGANILVDGQDTGLITPAVVEMLAGEHDVALTLPGHQAHRQRILVTALEERSPPPIRLRKSDAVLRVRTQPSQAGVTINGQYRGESPVTASLQSGRKYRVQAFKAGFAQREASLSLKAGETRNLNLNLQQITGKVAVEAVPAQAQLYVDGALRGPANQIVDLPVRPLRLAIKADGYASYQTEIRPRQGLTQQVRVKLLTLAEARMAALRPEITSAQGHKLKLFQPSPITLGASRREPGRRANETLREVALNRLFYLGLREVTNARFQAFASGHDSGEYEGQALNKDEQPAVELSWHEAALYCNWLSAQEGLPPFYLEEFGKATGFDPQATGYRLPTEAEWAWAARHQEGAATLLRFPWGEALPPPSRHGNYADRSAGHLVGRIIFGYNDNYPAAAPVGAYPANAKGIFDLGGNVAEWTNDFYQHPVAEGTGPLGPVAGEYHVIRGASWMHGTTTDLRLSFRDYGIEGRRDLGFRIARFAEAQ